MRDQRAGRVLMTISAEKTTSAPSMNNEASPSGSSQFPMSSVADGRPTVRLRA